MLLPALLQKAPASRIIEFAKRDAVATSHTTWQCALLAGIERAREIWTRCSQSGRTNSSEIRYLDQIVKYSISSCERAGEEPKEGLLDLLDVGVPPGMLSEETIERWYLLSNAGTLDAELAPHVVKLAEDPHGQLARLGTTGLRTWEAALRLTEHLLSPSFDLRSLDRQLVIELGSGCGLVSFAVAATTRARVVTTDGDPHVLSRLATNHSLNTLPNCTVEELDWNAFRDFAPPEGDWEGLAVLAADVTYDPPSLPLLVATLRHLLSLLPSSKAMVAATVRNSTTFGTFLELAKDNGFEVRVETLEGQERFWHPDDKDVAPKVELVTLTLSGELGKRVGRSL